MPHQRILLVLWGEGNGLDHIYFYGDPKDSKPENPRRSTRIAMSRT